MNGEILEGVKNSINWRVEFMACLTTEMCSFEKYKLWRSSREESFSDKSPSQEIKRNLTFWLRATCANFAITNSGQCSHFRPSYLFARRRNSPFRPKWEEKWPFPDDISAKYLSVVRPGRWCSVQTSIKRIGACSITLGKIHGPNCWRAWSFPPVQDAILEPGCWLNFLFTPFSNDLHVFYFDWSK